MNGSRLVPLYAIVIFLVVANSACEKRHDAAPSPEALASAARPMPVAIGGGHVCTDRADCGRRCDGGEAEECRRLADALVFDTDGGSDPPRSVALYVRACDLGSVAGCLSAGHMYEYHRGVVEDDGRAAGYYKKGCDAKDVTSCVNYAIMLENGRGVAKDTEAAERLYESACKVGASLGCRRSEALSGSGSKGQQL